MKKNRRNTDEPEVLTAKEAEDAVTALSLEPAQKRRVWEVDVLRGILILFVVFDHTIWDFSVLGKDFVTEFGKKLYEFARAYYGNEIAIAQWRRVTHQTFVYLFVLLSGVSSSFSRNNLKRAVKMMIFALLFTAVTYAFSVILHDKTMLVGFNVIHVIALSVLLWALMDFVYSKCSKNLQKNIYILAVGVILLLSYGFGYFYLKYPCGENHIWWFLVVHSGGTPLSPGDFLSFLPSFGYFLTGALLGKVLYREKVSLFPSVNPKYLAPLTFCGSHSLWIYFGSQIVIYTTFYLLSMGGLI